MAASPPPDSPVRYLPTDTRETPRAGVGLCLSGGGYRAMLFHLGSLWRLNELGMLPRLDRVCSVSGGSIVAAALGLAWERLEFGADGVGRAFEAEVATPVLELAGHTLDVWAVLQGAAFPGRIGARLSGFYARHLLGTATLQDLPDSPRFILCATNLASGELLRLSKREVADWRVGTVPSPEIALADAVACSSAFPPVLSPFELDLRGAGWVTEAGNDLTDPTYRMRLRVTDGGVYDNLGLETAWKSCATVLVSDAGGSFVDEPEPDDDWGRQTLRVLKVIDNQVRRLRKDQAIGGLAAGARAGAYWGIRSTLSHFGLADPMPCREWRTRELAATSTRLGELDLDRRRRLVNWGYATADAGMRAHVTPQAPPPGGFPFPGSGV